MVMPIMNLAVMRLIRDFYKLGIVKAKLHLKNNVQYLRA